MIQIKHIESNTVVTPMPSGQGRFGDETLPNCPAEHCCLVMAARTTALRNLVSQPQLTEEECMASISSILDNKDSWTDEEKSQCEVTEDEIQARIDEIRGFTDEDVKSYIRKYSVKGVKADPSKGIEAVQEVKVSESEAKNALVKTEMNYSTMQEEAVEVPSSEYIELLLIEEKEKVLAKQKCDQLVAQGFLVTDLDALDEDDNEIYADWKAQFEVVEIAV